MGQNQSKWRFVLAPASPNAVTRQIAMPRRRLDPERSSASTTRWTSWPAVGGLEKATYVPKNPAWGAKKRSPAAEAGPRQAKNRFVPRYPAVVVARYRARRALNTKLARPGCRYAAFLKLDGPAAPSPVVFPSPPGFTGEFTFSLFTEQDHPMDMQEQNLSCDMEMDDLPGAFPITPGSSPSSSTAQAELSPSVKSATSEEIEMGDAEAQSAPSKHVPHSLSTANPFALSQPLPTAPQFTQSQPSRPTATLSLSSQHSQSMAPQLAQSQPVTQSSFQQNATTTYTSTPAVMSAQTAAPYISPPNSQTQSTHPQTQPSTTNPFAIQPDWASGNYVSIYNTPQHSQNSTEDPDAPKSWSSLALPDRIGSVNWEEPAPGRPHPFSKSIKMSANGLDTSQMKWFRDDANRRMTAHWSAVDNGRSPNGPPPANNTPPLICPIDVSLQHDIIRRIRKGGDVTTVGNIGLSANDMRTLEDGAWLNDEIVNSFLAMVCQRGNKLRREGPTDQAHRPRLISTDVPQIHAFNSGWIGTFESKGVATMSRWAKRAKIAGPKLLESEIIMFPVCRQMHWTMAVVLPQIRQVWYLDSLGAASAKYILSRVEEWIEHELGPLYKPDEWRFCTPNVLKQPNGFDCGIFVCLHGEAIVRGLPFKQAIIADARNQRHADTLFLRDSRLFIKAALMEGSFDRFVQQINWESNRFSPFSGQHVFTPAWNARFH